jgi:hypothetical protein
LGFVIYTQRLKNKHVTKICQEPFEPFIQVFVPKPPKRAKIIVFFLLFKKKIKNPESPSKISPINNHP